MVRPGPLALALLALPAMSCASRQQISAVDLARRATASPLAAQRDLAGRRVVVHGVVRGATVSQRESVIGQAEGPGSVIAEKHHETLALVVLEPGTVLCYFEPEDLEQAADLKESQSVRLDCKVDSFRQSEAGIEAVLSGCERASP